MCGRFVLIQVGELMVRFMVIAPYPGGHRQDPGPLPAMFSEPRYNIAPTQKVLTVNFQNGERSIRPMRWGLIPSWAKNGQKLPLNINARDDRLATAGSWRGPLRNGRCLIPADGYYEWTGPKNNRKPVFIHRKDGRLFAFAGLYDTWRHPFSGELTRSCAIVTTSPNSLLRPVHHRMPVILEEEAEAVWLDPSITHVGSLLALIQPYPDEYMEAYPVGNAVNRVAADGPALLAPAPEQPFLTEK